MTQATIKMILDNHSIDNHTTNGRTMACESFGLDLDLDGNYVPDQWSDVTDWTLRQLKIWLGY